MAPFDGEDDQVEGVHGLDLEPGGTAAAGAVGGVEGLDDDALVAPGQGRGGEVAGGGAGGPVLGVGGDETAYAQGLGDDAGELGVAVGGGEGEQVAAVDGQQVEEDRGEGDGGPGAGDVEAEAVRPATSWKGRGRPSGPSAMTSPSRTACRAASSPTAAATSGSRPVMSSRVRV